MPLAMNREVFITCAVTGSGGTQDRSPHVPRSPKQIADSAIEAAKAGAAIVHCHVRDPETGAPARDLKLYREVTDRIREAEVDVVLNLTAGMGGDITFGSTEAPLPLNEAGTDMIGAPSASPISSSAAGNLHARLRHDEFRRSRLRDDQHARHAARDGRMMTELGRQASRSRPSTPAISGSPSSWSKEGLIPAPGAGAALHGRALGRAGRPQHLHGDGQQRARGLDWSAFSLGRNQMPYVAAACWPAAMSASGWRTTSISTRACSRPTRSWSSAPSDDHRRAHGRARDRPGEVRKRLGLTKRRAALTMTGDPEGRHHRRRRHRRRLGGPLSRTAGRRQPLRPRPAGRAQDRRSAGQRRPRATPSSPCAARGEGRRSPSPAPSRRPRRRGLDQAVPERLDIKRAAYAEAEAAVTPDALIGSSTSGFLPSELQAEMAHPGRLLVAHPFNPVYLLPLVEIVPGAQTAADAPERAAAIFSGLGMHPLILRKEIDAISPTGCWRRSGARRSGW
jgi:uncharacterized protein (DUF849 family)